MSVCPYAKLRDQLSPGRRQLFIGNLCQTNFELPEDLQAALSE
jgi:hypothetical protein